MIRLDYTHSLRKKTVGGISEEELESVIDTLEKMNAQIQETPYSFMELPFIQFQLKEMKELVRLLQKRTINDMVLLGIGGSSLGAEALFKALLPPVHNLIRKPRYWILDNIDPHTIKMVMEHIDKNRTLLVVISKSGETPETLSQFMIFHEALKDEPDLRERIVVITDENKGFLRRIAEREGYFTLSVPSGVGGRFSVLSPVGIFPALIMGINVDEIFDGAKEMASHIKTKHRKENMAILIAALLYLMDKNGKKLHVIMPYCDRLSGFTEWFRQLEAESLGKEGKGPTPVSSRGVTDQHSQLQLYIDGPKDKFIMFIFVPEDGLRIPEVFSYVPELSYFWGKKLGDLFYAELRGTQISLCEASVPSAEMVIEKISPYTMGALFYLFEVAISFFGRLIEVNPFDQPGVEKGKMYTKALMGDEGRVDIKNKLETKATEERAIVSF
ncbi:MAG: glucose-6-phosphate isomerase [Deltaproteobacteria bacterium]|nr:glucose-6-phosphate isomerase [Deltaproteobacteria bacterium]